MNIISIDNGWKFQIFSTNANNVNHFFYHFVNSCFGSIYVLNGKFMFENLVLSLQHFATRKMVIIKIMEHFFDEKICLSGKKCI